MPQNKTCSYNYFIIYKKLILTNKIIRSIYDSFELNVLLEVVMVVKKTIFLNLKK